MTSTVLPTLSVTVSVFTAVTDSELGSSRTLDSLVSFGHRGSDRFGTGLFCVTRESNAPETGEASRFEQRVLPAGLIHPSERIGEAAERVVREELGVEDHGRLHHTRVFDDPARVNGDGEGRVISFAYWTFVPFDLLAPLLGGRERVGLELVSSSELLDHWGDEVHRFDGVSRFGLRESPRGPAAHRRRGTVEMHGNTILGGDHDDMVFYSWRRLRYAFAGKLDPFRYLGTRALPEKFRLSDLRELSDVCRGERVQPDHFRRTLTTEDSFVQEAGEVDRTRPGKPASLYTLKEWAEPKSSPPS